MAIASTTAAQVTTTSASSSGSAASKDTRIEIGAIEMTKILDSGVGAISTFGNTHTGGMAWVDYNGDLWPDLFVSNGTNRNHFLFRNEGDGTFTDVSSIVLKPDISLEDAGVVFADIDNDGDSDILVAIDSPNIMDPSVVQTPLGGPNLLYINQGDGTFTEEAAARGLVDHLGRRSAYAVFADFDQDGHVDVYVGIWAFNNLGANKTDRLLRNDGTGHFIDVTASSNTGGAGENSLTALWVDFDFQNGPDLYIGTVALVDTPVTPCHDIVYLNNGNGTFFSGYPLSSHIGDDACKDMGLDVGDIDKDGDWDVYITDLFSDTPLPRGNPFYLGNPNGTLQDNSADTAKVQGDDSWPCNFADFDNDSWTDIWVGGLDPDDDDFLYQNNQDGTFSLVTPESFGGHRTRGGSIADYDGDGDVDIFMQNWWSRSFLYRNDTVNRNHFIQFKLVGVNSNRDAIGAVVRVTVNGETDMRRVSGGDSAHSQQELILTLGLGETRRAKASVTWPSGIVQNFPNLMGDQLYIVDEMSGIQAEAIVSTHAEFDLRGGLLRVTATTTYHGRSTIEVKGLGPLTWNAAELHYEGEFQMPRAARAKSITISSTRGGAWEVPVEVMRSQSASVAR